MRKKIPENKEYTPEEKHDALDLLIFLLRDEYNHPMVNDWAIANRKTKLASKFLEEAQYYLDN